MKVMHTEPNPNDTWGVFFLDVLEYSAYSIFIVGAVLLMSHMLVRQSDRQPEHPASLSTLLPNASSRNQLL